ncbi:hypothetical protein [Flavobacterium rhizosphaerae]|uniref:Uncharacterized protein n=1 Tax=Flavobacterium rhizosphaerae TaxID=3163298 RepID=A0ABW8YXY5_9FLAO
MSLLLYINGQQVDLDAGSIIAQTKQVNDLNSLDNRQASYTNKFKLPKTGRNIKIMEYLSLPGNNSAIPYQKNECSLYSETGECFVYKGWAVITDGGDDYEAVIYDGIIDLYKKMENKKMSDIDISELTHTKSLQNVIASWDASQNLKYRYILADYNGDKYTLQIPPVIAPFTNAINLDYLIPSAKVEYLWQQVFTQFGFTYSGEIFHTENFKKMWLTFPKGVSPEDLNTTLLESDTPLQASMQTQTTHGYRNFYTLTYGNITTNALTDGNIIHWRAPETGLYRLTISGKLKTNKGIAALYLAKNAQGMALYDTQPYVTIIEDTAGNTEFEETVNFNLQQNDTVCMVIKLKHTGLSNANFIDFEDSELNLQFIQVSGNPINFQEGFEGLSVKDFLNEIVYRFGLTMYKDKFSNNYHFLTLQEQLQTTDIENYSSKLVKKTSEKYELGNYAQKNWFRYKYSKDEDSYYDEYIPIINENLEASKDILKSKIYAPEQKIGSIAGFASNVYPFWEKETSEDEETGEITTEYRALNNRFYFLKDTTKYLSSSMVIRSATLQSDDQEQNQEQEIFTTAPFESYYKLPLQDIVQEYYAPIYAILQNTCIITADLWLNDVDIANFDFKKLYYIEQLASYFIMNKINNYIPGKPVKCEMLRVLYAPVPDYPQSGIIITDAQQLTGNEYSVTFIVNNYTVEEDTFLLFESSYDGQFWVDTNNPTPLLQGGTVTIDLTGYPQAYIRITDSANTYSNSYIL